MKNRNVILRSYYFLILFVVLSTITACNNSTSTKETELQKKEVELKQKESELNQREQAQTVKQVQTVKNDTEKQKALIIDETAFVGNWEGDRIKQADKNDIAMWYARVTKKNKVFNIYFGIYSSNDSYHGIGYQGDFRLKNGNLVASKIQTMFEDGAGPAENEIAEFNLENNRLVLSKHYYVKNRVDVNGKKVKPEPFEGTSFRRVKNFSWEGKQ